MTRRQVDVSGEAVTISALEPPPARQRHSALLRVALRDETTGRPPAAPITARLSGPIASAATIRAIDSGLVGVAGKPERVFKSTIASYAEIELDVAAPHFTPQHLKVSFACGTRALAVTAAAGAIVLTLDSSASLLALQRLLISTPDGSYVEFATIAAIGPGANQITLQHGLGAPFPVASAVEPLPSDKIMDLRPHPILIGGRILKRTGTTIAPLGGADVYVSKIWRQAPLASTTVGPEPPVPGVSPPPSWDAPIAAIWPPCYANFAPGAMLQFEDRPVDSAMPAKTLLDDVAAGGSEFRLSDAVGLNFGNVIAVDADEPERREIIEVTAILPSTTSNDWVHIRVSNPLALSHRRNRIVRRLQTVPPTVSRAINYPAVGGDRALLFDATGITGTHQVRLVSGGGPAVRSYHRLDVLATKSDAQGFYRLQPLTRAGKVEIVAKDSGSTASAAVEFVPDYTATEAQIDVTVS